MNRYKKISWKEYNLKLKEILVFGAYPNNDSAEVLSYKLATSKSKFKYVIFNIRSNLREKFE